jgi:endonuclease YncB( thermonuclease family)
MAAFDFPRVIGPAAPRRLLRASDGDTPVVEQPIRMVCADTPEKAGYAGRPATAQVVLDRCRSRLTDGTYADLIPAGLREYLTARLTGDAAERHIAAGVRASAHFEAMLERRLTRADGRRRATAVIPTGELIDRYGRLLAYLAPWFGGGADPVPPRHDPARRTFNLDMVAEGWAALFLIYPSLPREPDLELLLDDADTAWVRRRGMWAEFGEDVLLAYEFRACVKLGVATLEDPADAVAAAFQRVCVDVGDLRLVGAFDYHTVPSPRRLWIWKDDLDAARTALGLP